MNWLILIIAGELCVTPKYLSEICKRVSGYSANYWILPWSSTTYSKTTP